MQDLLTLLFNIVGISFIAIACYDFVTGYQEAKKELNNSYNSSPTPASHSSQKVATLEWLTSQIPATPEAEVEPVDIFVLAREKMKSSLNLSALKIYKLRGESVVAITDIPFTIPDSVKRYKLRGKYVVLEASFLLRRF